MKRPDEKFLKKRARSYYKEARRKETNSKMCLGVIPEALISDTGRESCDITSARSIMTG